MIQFLCKDKCLNAFLLIFIIFVFCISVKAVPLSPSAKISLITVGPGNELYSGFGHSAFWVSDPVQNIDRIYNYGTFDFNEEFYLKFLMGKLDYRLSISDLYSLTYEANLEGRYVIEQVLNLDADKKNRLFEFLENNYLPENRYYRYDFFIDNCSSRLRDALLAVTKTDLRYDLTENKNLSFRQLIDQYLNDKELQDLGMDIGLGSPADRKATPFQYMFLPEYLMQGFEKASIKNNGQWTPLVLETKKLLPEQREINQTFFTPDKVLWIIFVGIAFLTLRNFKYGLTGVFYDAFYLFFIGLLGCVLIFLWFFTDHSVTIYNWDLLWASPLHLIIVFLLKSKKYVTLLQYYFLSVSIISLLLILLWRGIPEEFNRATLPLVFILLVRSLFLCKYYWDKAEKRKYLTPDTNYN